MGRYAILFLILGACAPKNYHVVYTSKDPVRVYYVDPVTLKEVNCQRKFAGITEDRMYSYYAGCNVYLEYPKGEKPDANIPGR